MSDLDPRWEWYETRKLSGEVTYHKGRCKHMEVEPVVSSGETVAHLCLTCDEQLPGEWIDTFGGHRKALTELATTGRELRQAIRDLRKGDNA